MLFTTPTVTCVVRTNLLQGIGKSLETFAGQIRTLADSLPNQPPVRAISDRLSQRSSELGQESSRLSDSIRNAVGAPAEVVEAGIADMNNRLENLIKGECFQWKASKVPGSGVRVSSALGIVAAGGCASQHPLATHGSAVSAELQTILQRIFPWHSPHTQL